MSNSYTCRQGCGKIEIMKNGGMRVHEPRCFYPRTVERLKQIGFVPEGVSDDECWIWCTRQGIPYKHYGRAEDTRAHRLMFSIANQVELSSKDIVLHTCDNPPCVNPSHRRVGTQMDNIHDMHDKGRARGCGTKEWQSNRRKEKASKND